jgi:hypothetical protein
MAKARRSERHNSGFPFFLSRLPSTTTYLVPFLPAPLNAVGVADDVAAVFMVLVVVVVVVTGAV